MKPRFEISDSGEERTIRVRMIGQFDLRTMNDFALEYRRVSRVYAGKPHMVLADMRGSQPASPDVAKLLGETIEFSRQIGVVCCAHLSDDTVQRLQAARLARQIAIASDITFDVVSLEEAERVLAERRQQLLAGVVDPTPSAVATLDTKQGDSH
jgi:hypothetical protein